MSKGEQTRERIVERAMALASRDGFDGLSIGVLAEDLKLSKSGLFGHFKSKEDLELQVLDWAHGQFRAQVVDAALALPPGEGQLHALFENWVSWAASRRLEGGCVVIAAAHEFDDKPGPQRDRVEANHRSLIKHLQVAVRGAIQAGDFREDVDSLQFAHDMYALVVGYHQAMRLLRDRQIITRMRAAFEQRLAVCRR